MFLLDANILIDYLNNIPKAVDCVASLKRKEISLSVVTLSEVLVGCEQEERDSFLAFIEDFRFFDVNKSAAIKAAEFRQTYGFKLPDAYQAAIAIENKLTLLTRNSKDFSPKKFPFVKVPYTL